MAIDEFTERLTKVRSRFVVTLQGKIDAAYAAVPRLSGEPSAVGDALDKTYRCIHGIVGIGPTVGFPATGAAARHVEKVLLPAYSAKRGLTAEDVVSLNTALHALRESARQELESTYISWR